MKKLLIALLLLLAAPAFAQPIGIINNSTPIVGGSTGQCVTRGSDGLALLATCTGANGVTYSGTTTAGNVPVWDSTTGQQVDSGLRILPALPANTLWGNNSNTEAAPAALTRVLLAAGSASLPAYSSVGSASTGLYFPSTNYFGLSAGGNLILQGRSGSATSFFEMISSGGMLLRVQGTGNVAANMAALGTGDVFFWNNGGGSNGILGRFTGPSVAGAANNYLRFTVGETGAGPTITPVVQGTGNTDVDLNLFPLGAGVLRTTTHLRARYASAIGAGSASQAFVCASSTANFCVLYGTGDPAFSAAQGTLYVKTDASTATTRLWVNVDGSTTWAGLTASQ